MKGSAWHNHIYDVNRSLQFTSFSTASFGFVRPMLVSLIRTGRNDHAISAQPAFARLDTFTEFFTQTILRCALPGSEFVNADVYVN
jgi:hypothetical protein